MRIGIDAMGGDRAPAEEVRGALASRAMLAPEDRIVLVGRQAEILPHLAEAPGWEEFIEIRHAKQVIGMEETPVEALRAKPESSITVLTKMHRNGEVDACVSAGNTGAYVAAAQMHLRRLRGVHRPGIAVSTSTLHGPVTLCDVGANVSCRPQHLHQYGVMASVYHRMICGVDRPHVGLLSIGEEDAKGNDLVKRTRDLLREDTNLNFIGNVEGRDLFRGICDVVVCDGFVGNVTLKLIEGLGRSILTAMVDDLRASMPEHLNAVKQAARRIADRYDFNEYGGAPMLGVGGICIICHGATNSVGFKNAIRAAKDFARRRVNETITDILSQQQGAVHG